VAEHTIEFRVRYSETDQMGVVHHTNYLVWCEIGRTEMMRELGASYAELERRGVYLAVSEVRARFVGAARYDDRVRVRTRLERLRSRGVTFAYQVENAEDGRVLARAETDLVCLGGSGSPRTLPKDVYRRLQRALHRAPEEEGTIDALSGV
jgi:acyl-CoA thioester hydrolase